MKLKPYPKYKPSGVEWLGDVPTHWLVSPFKWQIECNDGGVWGNDPVGDEGTVVLRSTEQTVDGHWQIDEPAKRLLTETEQSAALLLEGDLLVTKSSGSALHIGKTTIVDAEVAELRCCYSNFMQRLRTKRSLLPRLAWYLMNNRLARLQFDFLSNSTTGLANLNGSMIGQLRLATPPIEEQPDIVSFLDRETAKIDTLISKQEKLIELLQEKRQAVISHAVTKGLDPTVPMKPSGVEWLGDVPEHWEVLPIKHLVESMEQGWSPQCENFSAGDAEWGVLKVGCVNGGIFRAEENKALPSDLQPLAELTIKAGDLLISRANTRELAGSAAAIKRDYPKLMLCDKLYRVRLKKERATAEFLAAVLGTPAARVCIEAEATGASPSMQNIGQDTVRCLIVALPTISEQESILSHIRAASSQVDTLITKAQQAIELQKEHRTALISAAVTGKIDVRGLVNADSAEEKAA